MVQLPEGAPVPVKQEQVNVQLHRVATILRLVHEHHKDQGLSRFFDKSRGASLDIYLQQKLANQECRFSQPT